MKKDFPGLNESFINVNVLLEYFAKYRIAHRAVFCVLLPRAFSDLTRRAASPLPPTGGAPSLVFNVVCPPTPKKYFSEFHESSV